MYWKIEKVAKETMPGTSEDIQWVINKPLDKDITYTKF
jgi:hypothetical protein